MASWLSFLAKPLYRVLVNPNWHLIIKGVLDFGSNFRFHFFEVDSRLISTRILSQFFHRTWALGYDPLLTPCVSSRFSAPK